MRIPTTLLLVFLISEPTAHGDDTIDKALSMVRLWIAGGRVMQGRNDPDAPVRIVLIGSRSLKDDDLPVILKPYPKLTELYLGNTSVSNVGLKHLAGFRELTNLGLIGTRITDAGLKELESLENLEEIRLSGNKITDEGLKNLGRLTKLKDLLLGSTDVTDEGLKDLKNLQELTSLDLSDTKITDAGLKELAGLKKLVSLDVTETRVTLDGEKSLKESLPDLTIIGNSGVVAGQDGDGGGGGQRSDPNFDVTVAEPAYTDNKPSVLFDEAHDNFHTSTGRYKAFADLITNDGYQVVPGKETITVQSLADFQILVIANAPRKSEISPSAFTTDECDAIEQWVKAGGSLLLVTDHEPFGSGSSELGKRFGVEMSLRVTNDPANEGTRGLLFSREKNQIGDHPIMSGRNESERVDRVLTFTGQSLKGPENSTQLLIFSNTATEYSWGREEPEDDSIVGQVRSMFASLFGGHSQNRQEFSAAGRAQGVALEHGRGRVVVMGEAAELSAQVAGLPPEPMGMNAPDCDNRQMVLNMVHWLSHLTGETPSAATSK